MGARDLLDELNRTGFAIAAEGVALVVRPATRITEDLRSALRASKAELLALLQESPERPHALSDEEGEAVHTIVWDDQTCARFLRRISRLKPAGLNEADADDLAERLHLRDAIGNDREMCVECEHRQPTSRNDCGNASASGVRVRGEHAATLLQRCAGLSLSRGDGARFPSAGERTHG